MGERELKEIYAFWDDEIKNDPAYNSSLDGREEMISYIRKPPYNEEIQETQDGINIRLQILGRTWLKARDRYSVLQ